VEGTEGRVIRPGRENNMKLIEVRKGDTFSIQGTLFTFIDVENDTAILKNVRKNQTITYGLEALQRIVHKFGYEIIA
jgi:flagella basal body P-ring formation protein FlgA